jgi:hypothetical protein
MRALVNWKFDTIVIQNFQQINDTTIQIQFNQNWQGYLYAEIFTSCGVLKDSLYVSVLHSPGQIMLALIPLFCPNNTLLLNAHAGYISYLWQNGSIDSTLAITTPGLYWYRR